MISTVHIKKKNFNQVWQTVCMTASCTTLYNKTVFGGCTALILMFKKNVNAQDIFHRAVSVFTVQGWNTASLWLKRLCIQSDWRGIVWEESNLKEVTEVKFVSRNIVKCSDCSGSNCSLEHLVVWVWSNLLCLMLLCNPSGGGGEKTLFQSLLSFLSLRALCNCRHLRLVKNLYRFAWAVVWFVAKMFHVNKSLLSFFFTFLKYELYHMFHIACQVSDSLAYKPFCLANSYVFKVQRGLRDVPPNGSVTVLYWFKWSWKALPNQLSEEFEFSY